jgi:phosphatidylglycerol---prolipoprotein diacylglyceryl transferase
MYTDTYGIHLGFLYIRYYGIILMVGALIGAFLAERLARRRGLDPDIVWDGLLWVLIGGVIGARIWHILTPPASMVEQGMDTAFYLTHPIDAINITSGGLGWPGAVMAGALALLLFVRNRQLSFGVWADIAVPALALGQAIGRWGNFFNRELYGNPSSLPWAIYIPPENRIPGYQTVEYYHPLFAYEALLNLINLGILLFLGERFKERLKPGDLLLVYLVNYGTLRFFLEFLRLDPSPVAGLNINQTLAAIVVVFAALGLLWRHKLGDWWRDRSQKV